MERKSAVQRASNSVVKQQGNRGDAFGCSVPCNRPFSGCLAIRFYRLEEKPCVNASRRVCFAPVAMHRRALCSSCLSTAFAGIFTTVADNRQFCFAINYSAYSELTFDAITPLRSSIRSKRDFLLETVEMIIENF